MSAPHVITYGPVDGRRVWWSRLRGDERDILRDAMSRPLRCVVQPGYADARVDAYRVALPPSLDELKQVEKRVFLWMNFCRLKTIRGLEEIVFAGRQSVVPVGLCRIVCDWHREAEYVRHGLILSHRGLAFRVAESAATPDERDEFEAEAHATLIDAVDRFNASNGATFSGYAFVSMLRGLARVRQRRQRIDASEYSATHEDMPGNGDTPVDVVDLRILLDENVARLTKQERRILALRFGLDGKQPHTLVETAKAARRSRDAVRTLQASAISKLRAAFHLAN